MKFHPLSAALGVRVDDLDLGAALTDAEADELRLALAQHHLLYLRAADLSAADQVRFTGSFGPLLAERGDGALAQYVSNTREDGIIREGALLFHSDLAFTPEPTLGLCLYAVEMPADGAPTRFANAARAWTLLAEPLRERIRGFHARHAFDLITQRGDQRYRYVEIPDDQPRSEHPVALIDPRTSTTVLYVNEMQTLRILELEEDESDALLEELFAVLYAEDNVYEHAWTPGDLLLWNNLTLQHARDVPPLEPRTLRRVTLAEKGTADQVPSFSY